MILDEALETSSLSYGSNFFVKALLIGEAGSGKTTGAITGVGEKLIIDTDQGREALFGRTNIRLLEVPEPNPRTPKAFLRLQSIKNEIEVLVNKGQFPYQWVILDSITRLYDIAMNWALLQDSTRDKGGAAVGTHYKIQKKDAEGIIEFFLHAPFHFVATVHAAPERDELLGTVTMRPDITGKHAAWITRRFREVYLCFTKTETGKGGEQSTSFWWRTQPDTQYPYLKSSLNTGGKYWPAVVEPNFDRLMRIRGAIK